MATVYLRFALLLALFDILTSKSEEFENISLHVEPFPHREKRSTMENIVDPSDQYKEVAFSGLLKESYSFDKSPMSRLSMSCKGGGYSKIIKAFPLAEIRWKHNGDNLILQPSRMVTTLNSLTIQNLIPSDGGVYHCQLGLTDTYNLVVKIYSVVVGNQTKRVHISESLSVNCRAKELGNIFEKATRVWYNPAGIKTMEKPANDSAEDVIFSADNKTEGTWTCHVENSGTKQTWKTARINIILEPPLSDWNKIKRYAKSNKPVVFAALFLVTFIVVLFIDGITKILEWKEKTFKKELDEVQKILGLDPAGVGPDGIPLLLDEEGVSDKSYEDSESESESNA